MGNRVAIGVYESRVVAWLVGTNPPEIVYEDGHGFLTPARTELDRQGYEVAVIFEELTATNILIMVEAG